MLRPTLSVLLLAGLVGCSANRAMPEPQTTVPVPIATPVPELKPSFHEVHRVHMIQQGDTLWDLSAAQYGDPFLWPTLYKANRDFLHNPELIEARDTLRVPEAPNRVEAERVRWLAGTYIPFPLDQGVDVE